MLRHVLGADRRNAHSLATESGRSSGGSNNCEEFRLHALDSLAEQAQKELQHIMSPAASSTTSAGASHPAESTADVDEPVGGSQRQSDAHALLAFVLAQLGRDSTAAQHYHAAAHLIEGKIGDHHAHPAEGAHGAERRPDSQEPMPSLSDRSRAIGYYRAALALDPSLERARYALAIALIETGRAVEEGVRLLRQTVLSTDAQVHASSLAALQTLQSAYGTNIDHLGSTDGKRKGRK